MQPVNDVTKASEVECFDTDVDEVVGIVNWERLRSDLLRYSQDTPLTEAVRGFRSRVCVFAGIIDQDKFVDAVTKFRWQSDDKIRSGLSEQRWIPGFLGGVSALDCLAPSIRRRLLEILTFPYWMRLLLRCVMSR